MDQRIDASQHEETLKWDLQFSAKNIPQAINLILNSSASQRGITKAGACIGSVNLHWTGSSGEILTKSSFDPPNLIFFMYMQHSKIKN